MINSSQSVNINTVLYLHDTFYISTYVFLCVFNLFFFLKKIFFHYQKKYTFLITLIIHKHLTGLPSDI